jgi:competence ComEA-like helix-hairpin-helix protein
MKKWKIIVVWATFVPAVLLFGWSLPAVAADLQRFTSVRLVDHPANDGDSFVVDAEGKRIHLRLYYVDSPETAMGSQTDARRVREQARYFGLPDAARVLHFGHDTKAFVQRMLAQPFTVHTAFASAMGRSPTGRVYGFVITADGKDLASLLVEHGLARVHGVKRETPDGVPQKEMVERLRDLEASAMLKRAGIWSESRPERIAELRAAQRSEARELQDLQSRTRKTASPTEPIDLNTATERELQAIKGIGPVLAARIIAGRPYHTVEDLLRVKGISQTKFEEIRPYVTVGKEEQKRP